MPQVPQTTVALKFIDAQGYPPLYYGDREHGPTLASVNAGNSQGLYVGGGGINAGFAQAFSDPAHPQDINLYATLHLALLKKAGSAAEAFETYASGSGNPLVFSYVRTARTTSNAGYYDGVCFIDVFAAAGVPKGNPANAAMAYLAPPYGGNYADEPAFLQAITAATGNLVATVTGYNAIVTAGQHPSLPAIEALRLCLFSSGIYNTKGVSQHKIARTIYAALCGALAQDAAGLKELHLPVPHDPLFAAVQSDLP